MSNAKSCALLVLLAVAGCATQPDKSHATATASANAAPDTQCHTEQPIGSLISKTVCNTKAQRDAQQGAVDEFRNQSTEFTNGRPGK